MISDHARVLDVPLARVLFDVSELRADFGVELLVFAHVLLEDGRHLAAELDVLRVDLVDVLRVAEHLDDLIEKVVERLVADLDAFRVRDSFAHAAISVATAARPVEELACLLVDVFFDLRGSS